MGTALQVSILTEPRSIVVAGARSQVSNSIERTIGGRSDLRLVATCESSQDTWQYLRRHSVDVLLLDWWLPDTGAMSFLRRVSPGPDLNVILLTDERNPSILAQALILGARGAISRGVSGETILRCTQAVLKGELWFSRKVTRALRDQIATDQGPGCQYRTLEECLTAREADVVRLVGRGLTNMEIARELGISHQTVRHHLKSVFSKAHVASRLELALLAERDRL